MTPQLPAPDRLVVLDIDGLRRDVFWRMLAEGRAPALARLLGGPEADRGLHLPVVTVAPSITFCGQSSIFTGAHPEQHGVPGNQFFDRFGRHCQGVPRHYAFDVGDTLAVDDAVRVFMGEVGLASQTLAPDVQTLYEAAAQHGRTSTVVYNMISRGATHWIKPNLADIARFTKGGGLLGVSAERYDGEMLEKALAHLAGGARPDVLTLYFMGLDHHSHQHGPSAQPDYLTRVVDAQVSRLLAELEKLNLLAGTLFAVVSDHGQIEVMADDAHSLRLGFPFDRELGYLFDALKLDVHDYPGEGPNCNAVVSLNGGLAHVYLQNRRGKWGDVPGFEAEVRPVAQAFWEANATGRYAQDVKDALAMVLIRNVEKEGWEADYAVFTPEGLTPVGDYLAAHPEIKTLDAVQRLRRLASPVTGDLLLVSNYCDHYYFGGPLRGVHGGLHPEDSEAVLSFGWPTATPVQAAAWRETALGVVADRRQAEGGRSAGVVDMVPVLCALMGW
jgi:hypothetical protein